MRGLSEGAATRQGDAIGTIQARRVRTSLLETAIEAGEDTRSSQLDKSCRLLLQSARVILEARILVLEAYGNGDANDGGNDGGNDDGGGNGGRAPTESDAGVGETAEDRAQRWSDLYHHLNEVTPDEMHELAKEELFVLQHGAANMVSGERLKGIFRDLYHAHRTDRADPIHIHRGGARNSSSNFPTKGVQGDGRDSEGSTGAGGLSKQTEATLSLLDDGLRRAEELEKRGVLSSEGRGIHAVGAAMYVLLEYMECDVFDRKIKMKRDMNDVQMCSTSCFVDSLRICVCHFLHLPIPPLP